MAWLSHSMRASGELDLLHGILGIYTNKELIANGWGTITGNDQVISILAGV